ncbi:hypothetical protein BSZ35_02305 [Salinibacter sp. 10B]|uniref:LamG-like jellyroll fold domain-containing protein n=1 Tax=Salinibacter sp. 10B TaxID=1923971 RepID=UPI000D26857B|nr:LamG-like jellyroll fold domain-containing protein [Salinibacter sp. 10B]PQJ33584.1 hypothetical protein BSZ35_02305 [Salinibacter sp. 10B]
MSYRRNYMFVVGSVALALILLQSLCAKAQGLSESTVREAGETVNLFKTIDSRQSIDGAVLELPPEWELREVRVLRYGTEPVSFDRRPRDQAGGDLLVLDRAIRGPLEFIVRVQLPDQTGRFEWTLSPFVWEKKADPASQRQVRRVLERQGRVDVRAVSSAERGNHALDLSGASTPLLLRAGQLPPLGRASSFTIEFWMQTNGLDEVVLSTWSGNEAVAYPAEFIVDRSGRLRFYSGRPGQHQALRSGTPVADGRWHHIAAVYEAKRSRLRLIVNGTATDSLQGRVPVAPGPVPMALGGRVHRKEMTESEQRPLYSGRLDELRIWKEARSPRMLRRMRNRPLPNSDKQEDRRVRLGFEEEGRAVVNAWPDGARRVPVTLSLQSGLRHLRAKADGRSVTLRWKAQASEGHTFLVERSTNGEHFTTVAELSPSTVTVAPQGTPAGGDEFVYTDSKVAGQVVYYRVRQQRRNGSDRLSGTIKIGLGAVPQEQTSVRLIGNFPNPFAETTTIAYDVRSPQTVTLTVWNLKGHRIAELATGRKEPGYHDVSFSAEDLPSGTYFVRLKTQNGTDSHRMVVLK